MSPNFYSFITVSIYAEMLSDMTQNTTYTNFVINFVGIPFICFSRISPIENIHWKAIYSNYNYTSVEKGFQSFVTESTIKHYLITTGHMFFLYQNPANCTTARKLVICLDGPGYGSQIHRLAAALSIAIYTGRTLIFDDSKFR